MSGQKVATAVLEIRTDTGSFNIDLDKVDARGRSVGDTFKQVAKDMARYGTASTEAGKAIAAAAAQSDAATRTMGSGFKTLAGQASQFENAIGGAFAQMTAAFSAASLINRATGALFAWTHEVIAGAGALVDLSTQTGNSTEQLQRWAFVGKQANVTVEDFADAAFKLGVKLSGGSGSVRAAVGELGLSFQELKRMSPDDQFNATVKALESMEDAQARNRIGVELFGRSFAKIAPAVAKGYTDMASQARVASDAQIKAIDDASDAFDRWMTKQKSRLTSWLGDMVLANDAVGKLTAEQMQHYQALLRGGGDAQGFLLEMSRLQAKQIDINLPKEQQRTDGTTAYGVELRKAMAEVDRLTAGQIKEIAAAQELGKSTDDIVNAFGLSDGALKVLIERTRAHEEAQKKATEATRAFQDVLRDVTSHSDTFGALLDTIDGNVVEGTRFYLERGAAIEKIAAMYGITKAQVEAVAQQMKFESSVTDATTKAFGAQHGMLGPLTARYGSLHETLTGVDDETGLLGAMMIDTGTELLGFADEAAFAAERTEEFRKKLHAVAAESSTLGQKMAQVFIAIPGMVANAFTGGGGILGALKGLGSMAGSALGEHVGTSIAMIGKKAGDLVKGISKFAGPIGAAIGSLAGPLIEGLMKLFDHVPSDLRKKAAGYGVQLSDAMLSSIQKSMNELHLSQQAATIFNAAQLFPTVDATNFAASLRATRDAFSMLATHQLTAAQTGKVLQDMWPNLAKAGTSAIGVINKGLVEMIRLDTEAATHTQAIADFLKDQATSGASSFSEALGVTSAAYQQLADDQQKLADLQGQSQTAEVAKQIADLTKDIVTQQGIIDATGIKSQAAADAMGSALMGEFDGLLASGTSFADAIKLIGPGIDALGTELLQTGLQGSAAFAGIKAEVDLYNDAVAGPALQAANALGKGIVSLGNQGKLDQATFAGLGAQITETFDSLVRQGKDGGAVMVALQDPLQALWEEQQQFGLTLDDATQALLDEAEAAGEVGEKHKSSTDQMIDALNQIDDDLRGIAQIFGVDLPRAIGDTAAAFAKIPKKVDVDIAQHLTSDGPSYDPSAFLAGDDWPGGGLRPQPLHMKAGGVGRIAGLALFYSADERL